MVYFLKRKRRIPARARSEYEEAKEVAYRFLSYRPRSVEEVRGRLREKNFSPHIIEKTLARIVELGYLNDRDYAYAFACSSLETKHWGIERVRDALVKRGISTEIINNTLDRIKKNYDSTRVAHQALKAKFKEHASQIASDDCMKRKAITFLRGKGFGWDTIRSVLTLEDIP